MRCMHAPRTRTKERGILVCSSWSSGVCRGPGLIWYVHHWWVLCCWHIDRMHGRQIEFCPEPARVSTGAEWSAPVFLVTCFFSLFALEFLSSGLTRRQSVAWLELITTHPRGTHFWGWKKNPEWTSRCLLALRDWPDWMFLLRRLDWFGDGIRTWSRRNRWINQFEFKTPGIWL